MEEDQAQGSPELGGRAPGTAGTPSQGPAPSNQTAPGQATPAPQRAPQQQPSGSQGGTSLGRGTPLPRNLAQNRGEFGRPQPRPQVQMGGRARSMTTGPAPSGDLPPAQGEEDLPPVSVKRG